MNTAKGLSITALVLWVVAGLPPLLMRCPLPYPASPTFNVFIPTLLYHVEQLLQMLAIIFLVCALFGFRTVGRQWFDRLFGCVFLVLLVYLCGGMAWRLPLWRSAEVETTPFGWYVGVARNIVVVRQVLYCAALLAVVVAFFTRRKWAPWALLCLAAVLVSAMFFHVLPNDPQNPVLRETPPTQLTVVYFGSNVWRFDMVCVALIYTFALRPRMSDEDPPEPDYADESSSSRTAVP